MKYSITKVLVLRPQAKLLVLINDQLNNFNWGSVTRKKQVLTAYILPYFKDDSGMLMNLENNYLNIFRNELDKIVGQKNSKKLTLTFFDFLSCFKFEWHIVTRSSAGMFVKKVCLSQKKILMSRKDLSVEDICKILDETNSIEQVAQAMDLSQKKSHYVLNIKFGCILEKALKQLKVAYIPTILQNANFILLLFAPESLKKMRNIVNERRKTLCNPVIK